MIATIAKCLCSNINVKEVAVKVIYSLFIFDLLLMDEDSLSVISDKAQI